MQVSTVREAIDGMAGLQPEKAFLVDPESSCVVTFLGLQQESIRLSCVFKSWGLAKGDKVVFLLDNSLSYGLLFLGSMYGGYVAVPLNVRAGEAQLAYMLEHCDAAVAFVGQSYASLFQQAIENVRRQVRVVIVKPEEGLPVLDIPPDAELFPIVPADPALLMYSSGSTGKPKGAIHTHASILAHGRNSIEAHDLSDKDRSLLVLPLYHINAECVTLTPSLLTGGSVVIPHGFVLRAFWNWICRFHVTWSALVPTIIAELVNWTGPETDQGLEACKSIRFLRSSSAPLSPSLHRQFIDRFHVPLLQAMGSTECGNVFSNPVPPGLNKIGSPGRPWGFEGRIVGRDGADVAPGESGEVLLRGVGLMAGYYKDPEASAAVLDSDGWLHTGDLARKDQDGYYFIVGRAKELIIKGGVNIAPRQIDEVLESHPSVLEAAAVGIPDPYFGEDVIAFVVTRPESFVNQATLFAFCETRLGHFKTPSRIYFIQEMPKGPSGKVQRLRLLDPAILSAAASSPQSAGAGAHNGIADPPALCGTAAIEQIVKNAWQEALGLPDIDVDANFFALGGDSLTAIRCLSKLKGKIPVLLSVSDFFSAGSVAEQAALVGQRLHPAMLTDGANGSCPGTGQSLCEQSVADAASVVPHLDSTEPYPLSSAQQRLWFIDQLNPDVPIYNEAEAVRLSGTLNVDALERAFNLIVDRHAILRSTIRIIEDMPHAVIHKRWPIRIKRIDLTSLSSSEQSQALDRLLVDEPSIAYNLLSEPGIRVTLLQLGPREHVLILMMHHILCDWSSEGIIWRELSAFYRGLASGETTQLAPLPITHRDYALWQQDLLNAGDTNDLDYWEETLRGAPEVLEMPSDRSRPPIMSYSGKRLRRKLSGALSASLRQASRQEKTSLFAIFATALNVLIYRYSGSEDIPVGIPLADRDLQELQSVVGFLLHVHVLRTKLTGEMTFRELLSRVQTSVLELYEHRVVPFDRVVERLKPERNLSNNPLFQIMLNWRDRDQQLSFIGLEGLAIESVLAAANTSKFDLLFFATDVGHEIWLELEYSTDLFDHDRIVRLLNNYESLLEAIAANPGLELASIPVLTAMEQQQLLFDWNNTLTPLSDNKFVHRAVEEQVAQTPSATALISEGVRVSYAELNSRANRLAHHLRALGVRPDTPVAICVERNPNMVIAMLAVLKAGGAYVPLDPSYPVERLHYMIRDCAPAAILTVSHLNEVFTGAESPVVILDATDQSRTWHKLPDTNPEPQAVGLQSCHLAYIIYTSGSTGKPKGVAIPHSAFFNFVLSMQKEPGCRVDDTVLAVTTICFDIAGLELFLPLTTGARIVIASREDAHDPARLMGLIANLHCTLMQATPTTWRALIHAGWTGSPSLRILCGGEALPEDLAQELLPRCAELWNMYGPTETTVWSTIHKIISTRGPLPIGRPIANTQVYVLDARRSLVPVGIAGELYVGGDGLARGYLGRDDLTAERFIQSPFKEGARLYRTGDRARWLADGTLECLGRIDHQVKLRGFRIELGEIEAHLNKRPGIDQAVVTLREDIPNEKRLVAYYTPSAHSVTEDLDPAQLRIHLDAALPDYMIPSLYIRLAFFPRTPNGKLDRKALPAPEADAASTRGYISPRGELETRLAEVWADLLRVERVGRHDNFFDLGGHSLIAVQLISRLQKILPGRALPLRSVLEAPTLEQFAVWADRYTGSSADITIQLREGNALNQPFFCVSAAAGNALGMRPLAMLLDPGIPFYCIQNKGLDGSEPFRTIEDGARCYLEELRKIQAHGPYRLGGYCFGAVVAFEMACMLQEAGERVESLFIIDAFNPAYLQSLSGRKLIAKFLRYCRRRIPQHIRALRSLRGRQRFLYLADRLSAVNVQIARLVTKQSRVNRKMFKLDQQMKIEPNDASKLELIVQNLENSARIAHRSYSPRHTFAGNAHVFKASRRTPDPYEDENLGWGSLVRGSIENLEVVANHDNVVMNPAIQDIARKINAALAPVSANSFVETHPSLSVG